MRPIIPMSVACLGLRLVAGVHAQQEPLTVVATPSATRAYIGQPIEIEVTVAGTTSATIESPSLDKAVLTRLSQAAETADPSAFGANFRLVPTRPGVFQIPPFRARAGNRTGSSGSSRLSVKAPPIEGRPDAFLGGVGPFELTTEVRPASTRVGGVVDYRVTIAGPGSVGVEGPPDLSRLQAQAGRVERGPDLVSVEPPSRTFVFHLRPTHPGDWRLPPVRVAAFDPSTSHYLTRASNSPHLKVVDVPRLDPTTILPPTASHTSAPLIWILLASLALLSALAAIRWARRHRLSTSRRLSLICHAGMTRIAEAPDPPTCARVITESLVAYLAVAVGRPEGALTPEEAAKGIFTASGSAQLAEQARELLRLCDRTIFGTGCEGEGAIRPAGIEMFGALQSR